MLVCAALVFNRTATPSVFTQSTDNTGQKMARCEVVLYLSFQREVIFNSTLPRAIKIRGRAQCDNVIRKHCESGFRRSMGKGIFVCDSIAKAVIQCGYNLMLVARAQIVFSCG